MFQFRAAVLSGSVDSDVAAWRSAVTANSGSVSAAWVRSVNAFVRGCKADGIWDSIGFLHIYIGVSRFEDAIVPLKGPAPTNNNFVSADWNSNGLRGNGTSKFLNTNYADNSTTQNNVSRFVWIESASTMALVSAEIGTGTSVGGALHIARDLATNSRFSRARSASSNSRAGAVSDVGFHGVSRSSVGSYVDRLNSSEITASIASDGLLTSNVNVFARGTPASPSSYSDARLSIAGGGAALDLAALYLRLQTLRAAAGL